MKSLGEILKKQMPQMQRGKQIAATIVVEKANDIIRELFHPSAVKYAQAIYFKDKTIAITCLSSVMAQEIRLNEQRIISGINKKLGTLTVERVRYLV